MFLQVDGTGTIATEDRLKLPEKETESDQTTPQQDVVDATPFNENLFLDEDLDGLDDELNDLDLNDNSEENS